MIFPLAIHGQDSLVVRNTVRRSVFEKGDFNGNLVCQLGRIADYEKNNDGSLDFTSPVSRLRSIIGVNFGVRLFELLYIRTGLFYNLNRNINSPWATTDYTYSIERVRWDPGSVSYGYNNYGANKFSGSHESFGDSFLRGGYYVRYYNQFPKSWLSAVHIDTTLDLSYTFTLNYYVHYWDNSAHVQGGVFSGKPVLNFALRQAFFKNFYLEGGISYYVIPDTKSNWDPDFTYAFGYNKYSHLSLAFSYGNYSTNRFPWNEQKVKGYNFLNGVFSVFMNFRY